MIPVILVAGLAFREAVASRRKRSLAEDAVHVRGVVDPPIEGCFGPSRVHTGQAGSVQVMLTTEDIQSVAAQGDPNLLQLANSNSNINDQWNAVAAHIAADQKAGFISGPQANDRATQASLHLYNAIQNWATSADPNDPNLSTVNYIEQCGYSVVTLFTSSGASQLMAGLVQQGVMEGSQELKNWAESNVTPIVQNAVSHLMGSLVAGALGTVALAATATGVGAVIGAVIGIAAGVIEGLLGGSSPPPYQVGNCGLNYKPDIVVKYTWMARDEGQTANPIVPGGPGAYGWRKFPTPQSDPDWYTVWVAGDNFTWGGAPGQQLQYGDVVPGTSAHFASNGNPGPVMYRAPLATDGNHRDAWWPCYTFPEDNWTRPIDHAFYDLGSSCSPQPPPSAPCTWQDVDDVPVFYQLEQEQKTPVWPQAGNYQAEFKDFLKLFFQLWKQNREFQLNGLQPLADWQVLAHAQAVWNNAHESNQSIRLKPSGVGLLSIFGSNGNPFPFAMTTYAQWLMNKYQHQLPLDPHDAALVLNMGNVIISHENLPPAGIPFKLPPIGHLIPINLHPSQPPAPAPTTPVKLSPSAGGLTPGGTIGLLVLAGALGTASLMRKSPEGAGEDEGFSPGGVAGVLAMVGMLGAASMVKSTPPAGKEQGLTPGGVVGMTVLAGTLGAASLIKR